MSGGLDLWITITLALVAAIAGGALGLWFAAGAAAVPKENRDYLDRPPTILRYVWRPIRWLGFYLRPLCTTSYCEAIRARLALAGLEFAIEPVQFVAACCWSSFSLMAVWAFIATGWGVLAAVPALCVLLGLGVLGWWLPLLWLRDCGRERGRRILSDLPFTLDIVTLCVEGGLSLTNALEQAVMKCPAGPLREEIAYVLRDLGAGKARAKSLRDLANRLAQPAMTSLVGALIQSDTMGMSLGPILRAQAEQRRIERFARAEKLAVEAPVKMLLPLIGCIFPCTFLIIGFPIAMKFLSIGL
jgi:tight adherence protein C